MKNTTCLALIILTVFPASAQTAAHPNGSANGHGVITSTQDYALRVDGLLREVHANLQTISARIEAGEVTPERGGELKLEATREMISRLDTLAATYDVRHSKHTTDAAFGAVAGGDPSVNHDANVAPKTNATVSVQELKREARSMAAAPLAGENTR